LVKKKKAKNVVENKKQGNALGTVNQILQNRSLKTWDDNIAWLSATEGNIDYQWIH
jgi:dipeptidyl-peptidase-3